MDRTEKGSSPAGPNCDSQGNYNSVSWRFCGKVDQ